VTLTGDGEMVLRMEDGVPGTKAFRVHLERISSKNLSKIVARRKWWSDQGIETKSVELGTIFGFHGTVLDTRETLLVAEPDEPTKKKTQQLARRIKNKTGLDVPVRSWLQGLPSGTIVMEIPGRDLVFQAPDLLWFSIPDGGKIVVHNVEYEVQTSSHRGREHRTLSGLFFMTPDQNGSLALVQAVGAEKLLRSIVPSEIYPSAPDSALQAQAITARSDLLAKIGKRHLSEPFLICNEVHCQSHRGENRHTARTDRAVAATHGQVLFHENSLVPALYHASCGGHTEANERVWPGSTPHPALRGIVDNPGNQSIADGTPTDAEVRRFLKMERKAYCSIPKAGRKAFRWEVTRSARNLKKKLDPRGRLGTIRNIRVLDRNRGGHATRILVEGSRASKEIGPELTIRRSMGKLRSSLFVLKQSHDAQGNLTELTITGGGFGHGVGMCQNGAVGMALQRKSTEEILHHYYINSEIRRIY
jgi:SpoIID/LytB domain protein